MDERQKKQQISEASDEEGVQASDDREVEFEEGWAPKQLYTASLEHRTSEDKLRLPGASDEEAGAKLPRAEIKQRRRKGGTPSTSPRALNKKHKHYN